MEGNEKHEKFGVDEAAVMSELLRKVDKQTELILELKFEIEFLKDAVVIPTKEKRRKDLIESRKKDDFKPSMRGF